MIVPLLVALGSSQGIPPRDDVVLDHATGSVLGKPRKGIDFTVVPVVRGKEVIATVSLTNGTKDDFGIPPFGITSIDFEVKFAARPRDLPSAPLLPIRRSPVIHNLPRLEERELFNLIPSAGVTARFRIVPLQSLKRGSWVRAFYYWPGILDDEENSREFDMKSPWVRVL